MFTMKLQGNGGRLAVGRSKGKSSGGFTLVETLVAVTVLVICFLALFTSLTFGLNLVRKARETSRASELMSDKLETCRLYTWEQMTNGAFFPPTFQTYYDPGSNGVPSLPLYNGTISIIDGPTGLNYSGSVKKVRVALSWMSGGQTNYRTMHTYVSQYGLHNYE